MTNQIDQQTRRGIEKFFVSYLVLIFILGFAGNLFKLRSSIPIKNFWQRWCHNIPELAASFLFGSGFLIVGLTFIFFPKIIMQVLFQIEKEHISTEFWTITIAGLFIVWPGIDILSDLFRNILMQC